MKKIMILSLAWFLYPVMATAQNIVAAEYFFDTDPGPGNGTAITVPSPADSVNLNVALSTSGFALAPGAHKVYVRSRDANGKWSLYEGQSFSVAISLVAAEYFFDTDPGIGNGIPLAIPVAGDSVNFSAALPTAGLGFLNGSIHKVFLRTKDNAGKWSVYEGQSFGIYLFGLPVTITEFTAVNRDCHIQLNWSAAQELNLSKYEVEVSKDGMNFQKVTELAAQGFPRYTCSFGITDIMKAITLRVRLKCVDLDGSFKYSTIVSVPGNCKENSLLVVYSYPNPVSQDARYITIAAQEGFFNGSYKLALSDCNGKVYMVRDIVLNHVPSFRVDLLPVLGAGKYILSIRKMNSSSISVIRFEKI